MTGECSGWFLDIAFGQVFVAGVLQKTYLCREGRTNRPSRMLYNYIDLKDMKGLNYSLMRIICALIIGLLLVLFPVQAGEYLVITIGVVFLVPSLISLIGYLVQKAELRRRFPVEGLGSLLFGLWLVVMPGFFADLLTFVLGFILMMGGVQQMASLMAARSWMKVPGGFYVVPLLILIAGIVTLFNPTGVRSTAFIIIGVTCLVYALSELVNWMKFTRHRPQPRDVEALKDHAEDAEILN